LCMVLLAVRMVADVTETRIVIPSLEFKTCMTISFNSYDARGVLSFSHKIVF